MKRSRFTIVLLALAMLIMMPQAVSAAGTGPDAHAKRTVLLYMCGSDLETDGGMATHNLKQILSSKFSSDDDVNFIVMTGGAWRWHLDNDKNPDNENSYLVFPEDVKVPDDAVLVPDPSDPKKDWIAASSKGSISGVYNQIWEARGADSKENAGKMVLLDGDGLTGAKSEDEHELMSVPGTLKAFINYGVKNYPADKYDLILWDHAGGPAGGFAADEHYSRAKESEGGYPEDVNNQMFFSGIVDALKNNDVTSPENAGAAKKFDFIDFDACLMNSVELNFALADYTDCYVASAEFEPGYGQDYRGWLNMIGETPDKDAYEVGKKIVDDFYEFYENGDGKGQNGTLAVVDLKKLMESKFISYLSEMTGLMKQQAENCAFYDELTSALSSIRYGQTMNYFDLGNFASTISVVNTEISQDELDKDKISTDNVYSKAEITKKIDSILQDGNIIYSRGTSGILKRDTMFRREDGEIEMGSLHTSGMYIFFTTPDIINKRSSVLGYNEELSKVIAGMPEGDRRKFLEGYRDVLGDYALIAAAGQTVNQLIKDGRAERKAIDYETVRYAWTEGREDNEKAATDWNWMVKHFFGMRKDGESAEAKAWLENLVKQQAEEALSIDNVSAKKVKTKEGTGYKINIKNAKVRSIGSVQRDVGVDYLAAEKAVQAAVADGTIPAEMADLVRQSFEYSAGTVEGHITDDDVVMDTATAEEIIRWYNRSESDWDIDTPDNCWYAVKDAKGNLLAAAINEETPDAYYVAAQILVENDQKVPVFLKFEKGKDTAHLTELIFNTTDGGFRPIKVTDLTSTYTVQPLIIIRIRGLWRRPEMALPTSDSTFELGKDSDIALEYTDISKLTNDIGDTDGDGEVYHSSFIVRDIYENYVDITEIVNKTQETVISMDLARVRHKAYTGEKQTPELVYLGETLKEGVDYTWEFFNLSEDEPEPNLTDPGNYRLVFKGMGRFTGYSMRVFMIVDSAEDAREMVAAAEEKVKEAEKALDATIDSGNQDQLKAAYEKLKDAQNELADAEKLLVDILDNLRESERKELEAKIAELEKRISDLNEELSKAKVIDISHYEVTMAAKAVYNSKGVKPAVKVPGLNASDYKVQYYNNKKVGTAYAVITAVGSNYTGSIKKNYKITPKKAGVPKIKVGKKKITVTAKKKAKVTGGKSYQVRYRAKGTYKWKTKNIKKTKITLKKLKKGRKYQVQIRAYSKISGKKYYGAWSKLKTTKKVK